MGFKKYSNLLLIAPVLVGCATEVSQPQTTTKDSYEQDPVMGAIASAPTCGMETIHDTVVIKIPGKWEATAWVAPDGQYVHVTGAFDQTSIEGDVAISQEGLPRFDALRIQGGNIILRHGKTTEHETEIKHGRKAKHNQYNENQEDKIEFILNNKYSQQYGVIDRSALPSLTQEAIQLVENTASLAAQATLKACHNSSASHPTPQPETLPTGDAIKITKSSVYCNLNGDPYDILVDFRYLDATGRHYHGNMIYHTGDNPWAVDLNVEDLDGGMWLRGWGNENMVSPIQNYRVSDANGAVVMEGGSDYTRHLPNGVFEFHALAKEMQSWSYHFNPKECGVVPHGPVAEVVREAGGLWDVVRAFTGIGYGPGQ